ncbi:hypothetical protein SCHPADRAFT_906128 [Schizopora paradoxa]|uniref:RNA polymerase II subunit A C-terminal domain phosphatase n=1 Tax=Schizopora paradoxa TaxID=27342 RepID=A0A0H2RPD2_9AGAM|nr:hypothetical protein SCHPADRAFT_906128 [Schizopora paradoxa]
MASESTIYLPDTLPFPIKILSLAARASESISTGRRLLNYSFLHLITTPQGQQKETRIGTWDATFDGELKAWNLKVGDIVNSQTAKSKHALVIVEPCSHGVQVNGLCALCGMDMENFDYTGRPESSRATIQMTHSASGPVVSFEEAQRIERETADHLLKARKLSLIVDLDQTIVHATVDPTVGDWISEGEAWEERRARREQRAQKAKGGDEDEDDSGDSDDTDSDDEEDEVNPNWEALKDVKRFRLAPDNFGTSSRSRWSSRGKGRSIQDEGCLYYIKARPGWEEFLSSVSKKYEMHVYTMGTRAYAEAVCAAIDPDGSIFGGRILSRDESGSLTQKSLRRLFPCDTSMVAIIDDRADVWEWCPNLLKVIPFEFFVGIGDINSAFLPKVVDPLQAAQDEASKAATPKPSALPTDNSPGSDSLENPDPDDDADSVKPSVKAEMLTQNTIALEAQVEDRPLAKQQELLEEEEDQTDAAVESADAPAQNGVSDSVADDAHKAKHHHKKALLKNDDAELQRIGMLLEEVHRRFYTEYDNRSKKSPKVPKGAVSSEQQPFDVKLIIPAIRSATFAGVHLLFSGVIPTNTKVPYEDTEVWRMAQAFGATCHRDLSKDVTHVVTSKAGTQKVEAARQRGNIFVVWLTWFSDSIAHWRRMDEKLYLLDENRAGSPTAPTASSPPSDPNIISTDTDPEDLVDDDEPGFEPRDIPEGAVATPEVPLALDDVDWQDVNDEVELAMLESDSEDEENGSEAGGSSSRRNSGSRASSVMSEDDGPLTDEPPSTLSVEPTIPRRKRLRSLTPSEYGNLPQSPLAKRKKLAADRSGLSKLKETISAQDLTDENMDTTGNDSKSSTPSPVVQDDGTEDGDDEEDEGNEGGDEIEDDFLLNALEEELG